MTSHFKPSGHNHLQDIRPYLNYQKKTYKDIIRLTQAKTLGYRRSIMEKESTIDEIP